MHTYIHTYMHAYMHTYITLGDTCPPYAWLLCHCPGARDMTRFLTCYLT